MEICRPRTIMYYIFRELQFCNLVTCKSTNENKNDLDGILNEIRHATYYYCILYYILSRARIHVPYGE